MALILYACQRKPATTDRQKIEEWSTHRFARLQTTMHPASGPGRGTRHVRRSSVDSACRRPTGPSSSICIVGTMAQQPAVNSADTTDAATRQLMQSLVRQLIRQLLRQLLRQRIRVTQPTRPPLAPRMQRLTQQLTQRLVQRQNPQGSVHKKPLSPTGNYRPWSGSCLTSDRPLNAAGTRRGAFSAAHARTTGGCCGGSSHLPPTVGDAHHG